MTMDAPAPAVPPVPPVPPVGEVPADAVRAPAWAALFTRRRTRAVLALLAAVLALGAWDGWRWQQARASNARILEDRPDPDLAGDPAQWPPPQRFTHARRLAQAGELEAALKLYRPLQGDSPLGQRARYNVAHLLLQQAVEVRAGPQPGQALPLIELAKEISRELLRLDPGDWDARYNLERAQRLLPDPPDEDETPGAPPQQAERAATTMRGVSPGLP